MKQKYSLVISLFLLFFINGSFLVAQNSNPLIHSVQPSKPLSEKAQTLLKDAVEDVSKRTLYTSTWRTKNGRVIMRFSAGMINYPDANGHLQPVDMTLHSDPNGWVADKQVNPCYFHSDRSTAISLGGNNEITFNKNCTINGMPVNQQISEMDGGNIKLDLSGGVHKDLTFFPDGIKTDYIFDRPLEDSVINVSEEVDIPAGCKLIMDMANGKNQPGGWAGDYLLMAPDGKQIMARFEAAECYDAKKHFCYANYSLTQKDGKNIFTASIPSLWLSKAVYPVTLDPKVKGTTSYWTGGSSPSCIYPNYHADSILITIPGRITVTYFTIDYAYRSSTISTDLIPVNDGIFKLYTSCGSTDTLSCMEETGGGHGDTAGICFLSPYIDFHNPLTCCYKPSCDSQTFWLYVALSRRYGGSGCDTSTIWYTKGFYTGFQYYFSAYVEGFTDSVSNLSYVPASQCSNSCNLTMNATIIDGVPPYRVSHQWGDTVTVGAYSSCVSKGNLTMNLKIPGKHCPYKCGSDSNVSVPPPLVIDFCGDTVKNLMPQTVMLKPVPIISVTPVDSVVCSGFPVTMNMNSCVPGTTFSWFGSDNATGSGGSLSDVTVDTSKSPMIVTYKVVGSANGCNSDTIKTTGTINPYPLVILTGIDTIELGHSETLKATGGGTYSWSPSAGLSCTNCANPVATPTITTIYTVTVTDSGGCQDMKSIRIYVLDENIVIPNVITPNQPGPMGLNSVFYISNLEYYPNSALSIYDRWGKEVYTSSNYQNNWNGGGQCDGVYYYILTLPKGDKYKGFFELIK